MTIEKQSATQANHALDWLLPFVPMGLTVLAGKLRNYDENETGVDDSMARIITELAPIVPAMITGTVGNNAADKTFLALYRISEAYLKTRGKLPE